MISGRAPNAHPWALLPSLIVVLAVGVPSPCIGADEKEIARWIRDLESGDKRTRSRAVSMLCKQEKLPTEAVLPLVRALEKDEDYLSEVVSIVSDTGAEAISTLVARLPRAGDRETCAILGILIWVRCDTTRAVPALDVLSSSSTNDTILRKVIRALANTRDEKAAAILLRLASGRKGELCEEAIDGLTRLDTAAKTAVPGVQRILETSDEPGVLGAAGLFLQAQDTPESFKALSSVVTNPKLPMENRVMSIRYMDKQRKRVLALTLACLEDKEEVIRLESLYIIRLFDPLDKKAIVPLEKCLKDSSWRVRIESARILGERVDGHRASLSVLLKESKSRSEDVRKAALDALWKYKCDNAAIVDTVLDALKDTSWLIRLYGLSLVSHRKMDAPEIKRAVRILSECDPVEYLRRKATGVLTELSPKKK